MTDKKAQSITLQQHLYASVPVGLKGSRGFQSLARSANFGELAPVEPHCAYSRPPVAPGAKRPADAPLPVNWGWFRMSDGRICVHRIGYSGTDEIGRPGNFMAHNLVLTEADAETIGFDIVGLIRWFEEASPVRYSSSDGAGAAGAGVSGPASGTATGFARHHKQVYDQFGREPAGLAALPEISVPVADLASRRRDRDGVLEDALLAPLRERLGPAGITGLLTAVLASPGDRQGKPVRVMGLSDGRDDSAAELLLAELLFLLLPTVCRRSLTFSTYELPKMGAGAHTPGASGPAGTTAAAPVKPHEQRRLVMSPAVESPGRPSAPPPRPGASARPGGGVSPAPARPLHGWVIDAVGGQHSLPPVSRLARGFVGMLEGNRLDVLRGLREAADRFRLTDEEDGLLDVEVVLNPRRSPLPPRLFEAYARLAGRLADRGASADFRETGHVLIGRWGELPEESRGPALQSLTRAYVAVLSTSVPDRTDAAARQRCRDALAGLLERAVRARSGPVMRLVLEAVGTHPGLSEMRQPLLEGLGSVLPRMLDGGRVAGFAEVWPGLEQVCRAVPGGFGVELLRQVAGHVVSQMMEVPSEYRGRAFPDPNVMAVPALGLAPLWDLDDADRRLRFVADLVGERRRVGDQLGAAVATEWAKAGQLTPERITELIQRRTVLLLAHRAAWLAVAALPGVAPSLAAALAHPDTASAYWRTASASTAAVGDDSVHRGLLGLLAELRTSQAANRAESCRRLAELYHSEGAAALTARVGAELAVGESWRARGFAHAELAALAGEYAAADAANFTARTSHLQTLLAVLLTEAARCEPLPERPDTSPLRRPLAVAVAGLATPQLRERFFRSVGAKLAELLPRSASAVATEPASSAAGAAERNDDSTVDEPPPAPVTVPRLRAELAAMVPAITAAEADWLANWVEQSATVRGSPDAETAQAAAVTLAADVVVRHPALAGPPTPGDAFAARLATALGEPVWRAVADRLAFDAVAADVAGDEPDLPSRPVPNPDAPRQEARRRVAEWFATAGPRRVLLERLGESPGLAREGRRLSQVVVARFGPAGVELIADMLSRRPPSVWEGDLRHALLLTVEQGFAEAEKAGKTEDADLSWYVRMAAPVAAVGAELARPPAGLARLERYLRGWGRRLAELDRLNLRRTFPTVWGLLLAAPGWLGRPLPTVAVLLLEPLFRSLDVERFGAAFAAAGESLFTPTRSARSSRRSEPTFAPGAEKLAALTRTPEMAFWFAPDPNRVADRSGGGLGLGRLLGGAGLGNRAADVLDQSEADPLYRGLRSPLDADQTDSNTGLLEAVAARVRFAASLYADVGVPKLDRLACLSAAMGEVLGTGRWQPDLCGLAVATLLTRHGVGWAELTRTSTQLAEPTFAATLLSLLREGAADQAPAVRAAAERHLTDVGVPEAEAAAALEPLFTPR